MICIFKHNNIIYFFLLVSRYLATGDTFTSLSLQFYRGVSTISAIVEDTAKKLWSVLQPLYMSTPHEQRWSEISKRFYELSNVPNCLGCIDGKHIRIKCPKKSGSAFYNYHDFFSIVLMACTDADGLFTWISVGEFGRNSDGRVIKESGFYDCIEQNQLNIPTPQPLPNDLDGCPFPFYFIGDQAFPLKSYLMRPYPRKTSTDAMKTFNYRMSRARRSVECGFGMLASKFRLFVTRIECEPTKVEHIVKAACILHNFIRTHDGFLSTPTHEQLANAYQELHPFRDLPAVGQQTTAKECRDKLRDYFSKPENSLPWQNRP